MFKETLLEIYERDLRKLIEEVNLYSNEADLWIVEKGISNSAGNLCLHLIGNLSHFIGATLGNTGYVRNRDAEFSLKNIPRETIVAEIEKVIAVVNAALENLTTADLEKDFPLEKNGRIVSTTHMLIHLLAHLAYHLGQVNYHRRLIN
jgi:uncharacterized damage-inducible protein DinB